MMFFKVSKDSSVKKILLVTLSNIGDVILTFPVLDALHETFPGAELYVVVGPKARSFFEGNPYVTRVIAYDKKMPWKDKFAWFSELRRLPFDLVVDLRNSMLPFLLDAKVVTTPVAVATKCHMKTKHLDRLKLVLNDFVLPVQRYSVFLSIADRRRVDGMLYGFKDYVVVAPGAADDKKRWGAEGFSAVIKHLRERHQKRIVIVGDRKDRFFVDRILKDIPGGVLNLCGLTTLIELAGVVERASLALTNDSGIMHLASYFNIPTVALFGPTDPFFYGPWSRKSCVVKKGCEMGQIEIFDVADALDRMILDARV